MAPIADERERDGEVGEPDRAARDAHAVRRSTSETSGSSASARKIAIRIHVSTPREIQITSSTTRHGDDHEQMRNTVRVANLDDPIAHAARIVRDVGRRSRASAGVRSGWRESNPHDQLGRLELYH